MDLALMSVEAEIQRTLSMHANTRKLKTPTMRAMQLSTRRAVKFLHNTFHRFS